MVTASMSITTAATSIAAVSSTRELCPGTKNSNGASLGCSLSRSFSSKNLSRIDGFYAAVTTGQLRRSYSSNTICCASNCTRASSLRKRKSNENVSVGIFKFQFPGSLVPQSLRSLLIDPLTKNDVEVEERIGEREEKDEEEEEDSDMDIEEALKRANWVERILELQNQWRQRQLEDGKHGILVENEDFGEFGAEEDCCCELVYDEEGDDHEGDTEMNEEKFSRLLSPVSWSDTKRFSKLAFLSNMAYAIEDLKNKDLKRCYGLDLVTSSLVKKAEVAAIKDKLLQDSTNLHVGPLATEKSGEEEMEQSHLPRVLFAAYEIAASAASYVQSKAKDLLTFAPEPLEINDDEAALIQAKVKHQEQEEGTPPRLYSSEMAAYVATSTMTAVVSAGEKQKQETARDLQSLQSSPCEWFICDDPSIYTRCFIIQVTFQANQLFG